MTKQAEHWLQAVTVKLSQEDLDKSAKVVKKFGKGRSSLMRQVWREFLERELADEIKTPAA